MAIFYTSHEGGKLKKFPKSPAHWWAMEQLESNISTHDYHESEIESNIFNGLDMRFPINMKCSYLCGIRVHSVFFTLGSNLYFVWDANSSLPYHRRLVTTHKGVFNSMKDSFKHYIESKQWRNNNQ